MKTDIYYFSGTGNSLYIARLISEGLKDSELISIPNVMQRKEEINGEIIGIICPIYMYNMPHIVADFIRTIKNAEYIFMVYAGAGGLGWGISATRKVFASAGLTLSALFNVAMPSNYAPYGVDSEQRQRALIAYADKRVKEITETVTARREFIDSTNTSFLKTHVFPGLLYRFGYGRINIMDNSFYADENCNGCSICQKVCPVNNITMSNDKPSWNNKCQQCYACLQWCPRTAIQFGKRTVGVSRYHNPNITVKEIIDSSPESM